MVHVDYGPDDAVMAFFIDYDECKRGDDPDYIPNKLEELEECGGLLPTAKYQALKANIEAYQS